MAKGLEDTAFYRYNRFIALNEVGGEPQRIGGGVEAFHATNAERARRWPHALSATATHDTKRGEDARARLAVLTELPAEWAEQVREWRRLLRGAEPARRAARRERRVLLLSVAARRVAAGALRCARARRASARGVRRAAARRHDARPCAKRSATTTWAAPDERYEAALRGARRRGARRRRNAFLAQFAPFASRVARLGVHNSLVQLALKLTAPGVPDIYQGTRAVGLQPRRSRQSPARRFRAPRRVARGRRRGARAAIACARSRSGCGSGTTAASSSRRRARCSSCARASAALFAAGDYARVRGDAARAPTRSSPSCAATSGASC